MGAGDLEAAARFPGFLGGGVLRPRHAGREWHVVYRFADADKQRAWETSAARAAWLARADEFARHTGTTRVSGLETWFALPGRTAPAPPKWKMAVVTFAAIYPLALRRVSTFLRQVPSGITVSEWCPPSAG
jgi:antibiotic biosynthesis monooxygenase (ABM) superfamily enzyme